MNHWRKVFYGCLMVGLFALWGGACGPTGTIGDKDGNGTNGGSEQSSKDGAGGNEATTNSEPGKKDDSGKTPDAGETKDDSTSKDDASPTDDGTSKDDATGSDQGTAGDQGNGGDQGTAGDQGTGTDQPSSTACSLLKGTCAATASDCQKGTKAADDPQGCSGVCCVPDTNPGCSSDADCKPTCTGKGVCIQVNYTCDNGACKEASKGSQPNATCDATTGTCQPLTPNQCQTNCDCNQGLVCVKSTKGNQCIAGTKAEYCCDKAGCPAGQACTDKSGKAGTCPTKDLCATVRCKGPSCALAKDGACTETAYTCNPKTGKCEASNRTVTAACKASSGLCAHTVPVCDNNKCTTKSTQSKASCTQSGSSCVQTTPTCAKNQCVGQSKTVANATCDKSSGTCKPNVKHECQVNCDCSQGLLCVKAAKGNRCIAGVKAEYCCDKAGCPAGQACTDKSGKAGTCPTKDLCATVRCKGPSCLAASDGSCTQTSYTCNPKTGKCEASTKKAASSCKLASDSSSCTQIKAACSNNQCTSTSSSTKRSCSQSGTSCIQITPTCAKNACGSSRSVAANATCNASTGVCSPNTKTACTRAGGYCTPQNQSCRAGYKLDASVSCGTVRSLVCCLPANKCTTVKCAAPTCAVSGQTCSSKSQTCDPSTGNCVTSSKSTRQSCSMRNLNCTQVTPICNNNVSCATRSSTTSPKCRQSGTSCVQTMPSCANNTCGSKTTTIARGTCNTSTGICQSIGTNTCTLAGGTCVGMFNSCPRGTTENTKLSCGGALSLKCCTK